MFGGGSVGAGRPRGIEVSYGFSSSRHVCGPVTAIVPTADPVAAHGTRGQEGLNNRNNSESGSGRDFSAGKVSALPLSPFEGFAAHDCDDDICLTPTVASPAIAQVGKGLVTARATLTTAPAWERSRRSFTRDRSPPGRRDGGKDAAACKSAASASTEATVSRRFVGPSLLARTDSLAVSKPVDALTARPTSGRTAA